jgi:hypothetical protein
MKSWQIPSTGDVGRSFEQLVSAASLNRIYADLRVAAGLRTGRSDADDQDSGAVFPESAALQGDSLAIACLGSTARFLAELIFERLWTIKNGRANAPDRGGPYARLDPNHEYRGTLLDRVVIGQRIGQIYGGPAYKTVFADHVNAHLAAFISTCGDEQMASAYLSETPLPPREGAGGGFSTASVRPGLLRPSHLRAAPALGAAIAAVRALE